MSKKKKRHEGPVTPGPMTIALCKQTARRMLRQARENPLLYPTCPHRPQHTQPYNYDSYNRRLMDFWEART